MKKLPILLVLFWILSIPSYAGMRIAPGPVGPAGPQGPAASWEDITGTALDSSALVTELNKKSSTTHNHDNTYDPIGSSSAIRSIMVPNLSVGTTAAPAAPVVGNAYIADTINWDPGARKKTKTASTIAFVSGTPATITDSGNGLVAAGFEVGMRIAITGSTSNNKTVTIASIVAGTITLSPEDTLTSESAGVSITLSGGFNYRVYYTSSHTYAPDRDSNGNVILPVSEAVETLLGAADAAALRTATGTTYDTDLASTSSSDDTVPTAKATKERKQNWSVSFDPAVVYTLTNHRIPVMRVNNTNGIKVTKWWVSFDADPTAELTLTLKRADAYIGVGNSATVDDCTTTNGAASETTAANINSGNAIADGKVLYLELGSYTETGHFVTFQMEYYEVGS